MIVLSKTAAIGCSRSLAILMNRLNTEATRSTALLTIRCDLILRMLSLTMSLSASEVYSV